jgi:pyruvate dehydrogenase E2 component (dihydrolipoamide acetyltransferase)
MIYEIKMPRLDDDMTEGTVNKWIKKEGNPVLKGEPVVEIETQKTNYEVEAPGAGILRIIIVKAEQVVPINTVLGVVAQPDEDLGIYEKKVTEDLHKEQPGKMASESSQAPSLEKGSRIFITPIARKMAEERRLDITKIKGTGPDGRITKEDVSNYNPVESAGFSKALGRKILQTVPLAGLRKTIAERMAESWKSAPRAEHFVTVDVTELVKIRDTHRERWENQHKICPSVNDFIIVAAARALKSFPRMNAAFKDGKIEIYEDVNISVAVALEKGLITPVLHGADSMDLFQVAQEVQRLAELVRQGSHKAEDLAHSTFTVSNLGMFDIDFFVPIINPPEAAILAVGKIEKKPVVLENVIAIRSMMRICLAYDHRVLDGAEAAKFLKALTDSLQEAKSLLPKEG